MNTASANADEVGACGDTFAFVQALAVELAKGPIDLPGFPDIVAQVRKVLADDDASTDKVAQVLGAEPMLAAKLLRLANSFAFNGVNSPASDLRTAIKRTGLNTVRSTMYAYAVHQLGQSQALKGLEKPLEALWQYTANVASLSYVLARKLTRISPDTALLAGLLHSIGRLYIFTRACEYRALFADAAAYAAIERDWHTSAAVALLEQWTVSEQILRAIADCENLTHEASGPANVGLVDILKTAIVIAEYQDQPEVLAERLKGVRAASRLQLSHETLAEMMQESAQELQELREALA